MKMHCTLIKFVKFSSKVGMKGEKRKASTREKYSQLQPSKNSKDKPSMCIASCRQVHLQTSLVGLPKKDAEGKPQVVVLLSISDKFTKESL